MNSCSAFGKEGFYFEKLYQETIDRRITQSPGFNVDTTQEGQQFKRHGK